MKHSFVAIAAALAICALPAAAELPFLNPTSEYSAMRLIETSEGDFQQKVYWTQERVRTETEIEGMALTNIVREDLGVMWITNSMIGACMEQPIESAEELAQLAGGNLGEGQDVDYEELGREEIDGLETTKYQVDAPDPDGTAHSALLWVTDENILVRMEVEPEEQNSELHFVMRLVDLELGSQPESLFESPGDCMKMPVVPQQMPSPPNP